MLRKRAFITLSILIILYFGEEIECVDYPESYVTGGSDFQDDSKLLSRIAFGSCMKFAIELTMNEKHIFFPLVCYKIISGMFDESKWYQKPQYVWKQIVEQQSDLWIWLGDAAYGDTRIVPFVWKPSPLPLMAEYFRRQKHHPDYKEFLKSNISIVGIWDDHDYGMNDGGKKFRNRLQTQDIFLDFLDEPLDSLRRRREGMYVSYTFGRGDKTVKLIMLDVRSFAVFGSNCDLLGSEQWQWFTEQLNDPTPVSLTIVTSGIQILSNSIPGLQNWEDCPSSYDRLIWLTRKRDKVIYLSGDVHFGETSCLNSSSSGYPLYELTSSGLYMACTIPFLSYEQCQWSIRNAIGNDFRITEPVVERNFGLVEIDWHSKPINIKLKVFGENGISSEVVIDEDHISKRLTPGRCPDTKRPEASLTQIYLFWATLGLIIVTVFLVLISIIYFICKLLFLLLRSLFTCLWKPGQVSKMKEKRS